MKIFAIPKKTAVQVVVAIVVIAALLGHDYPRTGLVVMLCSVGFYLLLVARRTIGYLLNFKTIDAQRRILAVTALCIFYIFLHGIFSRSAYHVLLILMLGIDYFIYDRFERHTRG